MHLVGFIIRIDLYITMHGPLNVKLLLSVCFN